VREGWLFAAHGRRVVQNDLNTTATSTGRYDARIGLRVSTPTIAANHFGSTRRSWRNFPISMFRVGCGSYSLFSG
jgi:hypothetical protein